MKSFFRLKQTFLLDLSSVTRFMILSDVVLLGAGGLLGPVFAIFIVDFVKGGSPAVAGIAASVYLITKSVLQVPIASYIDQHAGEKDDFRFLIFGSFAGALIPLLYLLINTQMQLYAVQFLQGVAMACVFPAFMAIFTRHISKNKEGTSWGIYFTLNDLGSAIAASVGGVIAQIMGFHWLIVVVSLVGCFGASLLFPIRSHIRIIKE